MNPLSGEGFQDYSPPWQLIALVGGCRGASAALATLLWHLGCGRFPFPTEHELAEYLVGIEGAQPGMRLARAACCSAVHRAPLRSPLFRRAG